MSFLEDRSTAVREECRVPRTFFIGNEGNNTFTDVTLDSGIDKTGDYYGLGVIPEDYDSDGDVDLFVANDTTPNLLFRTTGTVASPTQPSSRASRTTPTGRKRREWEWTSGMSTTTGTPT